MHTKAHVIIYSKPGCHLCEEAKGRIRAAGCSDWFELEEVNIESDPEMMRLYGTEIPVIIINGKEAFRHRLTSAEFRKALEH